MDLTQWQEKELIKYNRKSKYLWLLILLIVLGIAYVTSLVFFLSSSWENFATSNIRSGFSMLKLFTFISPFVLFFSNLYVQQISNREKIRPQFHLRVSKTSMGRFELNCIKIGQIGIKAKIDTTEFDFKTEDQDSTKLEKTDFMLELIYLLKNKEIPMECSCNLIEEDDKIKVEVTEINKELKLKKVIKCLFNCIKQN